MRPMRDVQINNTEVLEALNEYKDFLMDNIEELKKYLHLMAAKENPDDYLKDEYMKMIIDKGRQHIGFPEMMKAYDGLMPGQESQKDPRGQKFRDASSKLNSRMMQELSAKTNTLNTIYPPQGFIGWHNNANAHGYNIIFSWSENGDGWFDYWDIDKGERVRIPDHSGWQCKMTYFGPYDQPDELCYHAAYTDCWRISVAYVFAEADNFWEEVIEDIENPL